MNVGAGDTRLAHYAPCISSPSIYFCLSKELSSLEQKLDHSAQYRDRVYYEQILHIIQRKIYRELFL